MVLTLILETRVLKWNKLLFFTWSWMQSGGTKAQRGPRYPHSMSSPPQWGSGEGKNHLLSPWSLESLSEVKSTLQSWIYIGVLSWLNLCWMLVLVAYKILFLLIRACAYFKRHKTSQQDSMIHNRVIFSVPLRWGTLTLGEPGQETQLR